MMRILIVLTYFQPHKSGLTVYAVQQAQALAALGHQVTVLTSQYDPALPPIEEQAGVRIVRLPVAFRLSKGVIMPSMPGVAWRLIQSADVVNLHVPQVDAALVAVLAKWQHKPIVLTYHCDLKMPSGLINRASGWAAQLANTISAKLADVIIHNTRDFAEHSDFLKSYLDKLEVIKTPIAMPQVSDQEIQAFKQRFHVQPGQRIIGMAARLATEKGVEFLVEAMPAVIARFPTARTLFMGDYEHVFGEKEYREKLLPLIADLGDHWTFLGVLSDAQKAAFFESCEVLVLPSINSTESFGMVQIEAMICGTPVVASDLPGVRQPVQTTGVGKIVSPQDSDQLADAVIEILRSEESVSNAVRSELKADYAPEVIARAYQAVYQRLLDET